MIEDSEDTQELLDRAKDLGTIRIIVQRTKRRKRRFPRSRVGESPQDLSEISEAMVKGKGLANTVR